MKPGYLNGHTSMRPRNLGNLGAPPHPHPPHPHPHPPRPHPQPPVIPYPYGYGYGYGAPVYYTALEQESIDSVALAEIKNLIKTHPTLPAARKAQLLAALANL